MDIVLLNETYHLYRIVLIRIRAVKIGSIWQESLNSNLKMDIWKSQALNPNTRPRWFGTLEVLAGNWDNFPSQSLSIFCFDFESLDLFESNAVILACLS